MCKHTNYFGITITEILIGVIILALVLLPSLTVILSETKAVKATRDHTMAAFYAQLILETARNYQFKYLDADQYSDPNEKQKTFEYALNNTLKTRKINGIKYEIIDASVDPVKSKVDPAAQPSVMLVKFAVAYTGLDGRNHRLDVYTAIGQEE